MYAKQSVNNNCVNLDESMSVTFKVTYFSYSKTQKKRSKFVYSFFTKISFKHQGRTCKYRVFL